MQRIIYQNDDGGMAIVIPAQDCGLSIQEIARKDVPAGKAYKVVDVSDIPADRASRDEWTVDPAELTDGIGGE